MNPPSLSKIKHVKKCQDATTTTTLSLFLGKFVVFFVVHVEVHTVPRNGPEVQILVPFIQEGHMSCWATVLDDRKTLVCNSLKWLVQLKLKKKSEVPTIANDFNNV